MALSVEELENESRFRKILEVPYNELITFVFEYLKKRSSLIIFFFSLNIIFLVAAIIIRVDLSGYFRLPAIIIHTVLGFLVFPLLIIPVHELLHVVPFYLSGAKNIRAGMDLKQYLFYVTAHRHVATPGQFRLVAFLPFFIITLILLLLIVNLPGLWKWSMSLLLFIHTTMCAGDFAMLNFYHINRNKKIYTWDDADKKIAYFYEELNAGNAE